MTFHTKSPNQERLRPSLFEDLLASKLEAIDDNEAGVKEKKGTYSLVTEDGTKVGPLQLFHQNPHLTTKELKSIRSMKFPLFC